ncbi:inter-alpha-trypsin inhibitor heavy chain H6 [Pelobates cultripes]|uniref:Inter-alpha-trypsin inhibitor heavy chain H6 n=1 Tax=Pelobates cultripes TaxID=61616 RepID=A0AAD1WPX0_PELCU|nr:inter-alpha-trypsin inhibitor heavy chain H6 [Pelobates cultripes]
MLLRYFQNSFIMPRIGMLSSRCCVLFLMVILVHLTLIGWTRSESIYQQRFKRQSRASKTELTISSLFIQSTIVSRYAFTKVQTVMLNPHSEAKDAIFDLDLPSSAFISNFTLTVKGKTYIAEVKEKHQAKKMYEEARKQGKTTAHVGTRDRDTEKFRVMVNVEAGGEIGFTLTYEELLRRQLGKYEHAVSVRPGQIVQNLSVEVTISERTGIEYVQVLPLRTSRLMTNAVRGETKVPPSTKLEKGPHCARVIFSPSPAQQTAQSSSGIAADFVIQYDVALKDLAGDVQIYNGYFVHYFAPRGLPTIQKNVIFVIDVSGSMFGTKMKQTKSAMHVILNDLHRDDFFNIITFSDVVQVWKPGHSIQASAQNVKSAKEYVNTIEANGWTDINAALLAAASVFNQTSPKQVKGAKPRIPLIIFLTDGEATSGVTSTNRILDNVHKAMGENISLFCLAFGEDADYNLMRRLSLENRGIARRIYEYSDATLQLKGFYDEIASPLLFDIELAYLGETTYNVTQTLFPNYFQGSELVVTGKLRPGTKNLKVHMTAHDHKAQLSLQNDITMEDNATQDSFGCSGNIDEIQWFVQRLWAYFTIQDLLQARIKANDTVARRLLTEKATNLSLKYNFVTPVTSLIVVKPEDPEDTTTQAATTSTETTTTTISSTFSTISTVASTSTAVSTNKITGETEMYDSDDLLYQKSFDDDEDFDMLLSGVPGLQTFMSSVDGDPHFVVNLPRSQEKLCFTLDGRPGDILRLVSDSSTGITVNGHLMQAPFKIGSENRIRTYLDIITIIVNQTHANYIINISLNTLTLKGEDQLSLPLNHPAFLQKPRLAIKVSPSSNVTIWIGHDVELLIMFHQYRHPTYLQLDHLGFYIVNGKGLSSHSAGLLGQFQNAQIEVTEKKESNELTFLAIVTRKNHTAPATLVLKSMKDSPARTHMSKCWLVKHGDIENILDGKYISYVVTDLQEL